MSDSSWATQRRENARLQAERLATRKAAESAQAAEYLRRFVRAAAAANLKPEPLQVQGRGGKGRARTQLLGWYLKVDQTLAVDTDANFYLLTGEVGIKERLKGATPRPSPPPLALGVGARDGESMDLTDALSRLLPAWRELSAQPED